MEYRKFPQGYVVRLDPGEEIVERLTFLVDREGIQLGSVSALGAANDVMGLCAAVKVRETDASISLRLPGSLGPSAESACQALLTGMMVYLSQLHCEYPDFIEVMEAE